jgi:sporulation protein YlmC with PRC-barrel domain
MPTIDEYYSSGGSSLKASDIDDELIATIESWRAHTFTQGERPTVFLKLVGVEKEFRVNYTNAKRIKEMYGPEIEDWIGKSITLMPDVTKDPNGRQVDTITVRIRKTARNAPKGKPVHDDRNPPPPLDDEIPF